MAFQGDLSAPVATGPHLFSISRYAEHATASLDNNDEERGALDVAPGEPSFAADLSLRLQVAPGDPAVFEFDFVRVRVAIDPPPSANVGLLEPKR